LIHNERFTTSFAHALYRKCGSSKPAVAVWSKEKRRLHPRRESTKLVLMSILTSKAIVSALLAAILLLTADSALAFRCGSKLVRDGMHEQQVVAACGEPTSVRHLGHAIRAYDYRYRFRGGGLTYYRMPGVGHFATEVTITEFVYNFGPRKLMRRLIFEGNVLVEIETIGYGYIEK
jgi:hypothetical protein